VEKSKEDIFLGVRDCLINALGVEEDEITSEASLVKDLGAESIDFLDVVFRLEKNFNTKIPRGDLFPEGLLTNPDFVKEGKVTESGITELKTKLPHIDFAEFEQNPELKSLSDVFTVGMIVNYLFTKLSANTSA